MNTRQVLCAVAITAASASAMAVEATQFDDTPSSLTRAEVRADLERAMREGTMLSRGEATEFDDRAVAAASRPREEVRAEARVAAHEHAFNESYVGSI